MLDTVPIVEGSTAREALANTLDLAQRADRIGYRRYWVPEHHGMPGVAGSATSVIIERIASLTERIRVGSGGVLLPNHSPLVLAEQFGTLEAFHPGRIDLGLGRALGGRRAVVDRVRPASERTAKPFEEQLDELLSHFAPALDGHASAVPAVGNKPEVWLLGSTEYSARLAGKLGLPYAFAGHLNPGTIDTALLEYRRAFHAAHGTATHPQDILSVPVIAADTDVRARWLAGSVKLRLLRRSRKERTLLPTPEEAGAHPFTVEEEQIVRQAMDGYVVGSGDTVLAQLQDLVDKTSCQELMITSPIYDHAERCRSYEICARSGPHA
ncbi:LLM class flavin-dependent oxidoreductase [Pseudonocardia sp. RS010]|uniref:LLM class flavin-dependent oxidoreductase n=1 Tax=Pseudonocardia sp. RS010 TaxID=3385979 RepID=UPI0039A1D322